MDYRVAGEWVFKREKLAGALNIELEFFGRSGAKRRSYTPVSLLLLLYYYIVSIIIIY